MRKCSSCANEVFRLCAVYAMTKTGQIGDFVELADVSSVAKNKHILCQSCWEKRRV